MTLKIETWQVIHETEFSKLVEETYGRPYQLQQQEPMMGQNEVRHVVVPSTNTFNGQNDPTFEQWLKRSVNEPVPDPTGEMWEKFYAENPDQGTYTPRDDARLPGGLTHELWWTRDFYPPLEEVLNDLHRRGLIAEGEYHIEAWW